MHNTPHVECVTDIIRRRRVVFGSCHNIPVSRAQLALYMYQHPGFYNMDAPYFEGLNPKDTILESWGVLKEYINEILPPVGRNWHLYPNLSDARPVLDALGEQQMPSITRQEVITKLLTTCFGLAVSFSITYFGVKWLVNAMDPTREDKRQAHKRVRIFHRDKRADEL